MSELVALSQARAMLAEAETVEAAQDVARMAKVAEALAREADLGVVAQNEAVLVRAEAYAKCADLIDAQGPVGGRGNRHKVDTVSRVEVQRWRDGRAALVAGWHTDQDPDHELSWAQLVRHGHKIRVGETTDQKNEWYTPPWVFELLGLTFDIDVCAPLDPVARRVPARRHYTIEDDGLEQPWQGLIWCNPPYETPSPWIDRWAEHDSGLILTHASVRAKRTLKLWNAADAIVMFSKMYFTRPNGQDQDINLLLQIAARGPVAVAALSNVAQAGPYAGPLWVPA